MDQNNNFNLNQENDYNYNANQEQNFPPQESQINGADIYAPYNQPQNENVQESVTQQNVYAQNNSNGYYQPHQNMNQQSYNNQQQFNQNNSYGGANNYQPPQNQYGAYEQPQQYNDAYFNQQYPIYNFQEKPKGFAIASMIIGICSFLFSCCGGFITFFSSIAGLVLGIVSLKRNEDGKGMAIAGIVLSAVGIVLSICAIIIFVAAFMEESTTIYPYDYYNFYN